VEGKLLSSLPRTRTELQEHINVVQSQRQNQDPYWPLEISHV